MGIRTAIIASPPTQIHSATAQRAGFNASGLTTALAETLGEASFLLREIIKTLPVVNLSAASSWTTGTTIAIGQTIPASVVPGMNVFDLTNNKQIGTVASGAGTTTLTLTGPATNASQGSSNSIQLTDGNAATYSAQLAALG